jgi:hypothetical protein
VVPEQPTIGTIVEASQVRQEKRRHGIYLCLLPVLSLDRFFVSDNDGLLYRPKALRILTEIVELQMTGTVAPISE